METAVVVLITYLSLLVINLTYISLVVFPAIALTFIAALSVELHCQSRSQGDDNGDANSGCTTTGTDKDEKAVKKAEELKAISVVPYWVLCVMGQFRHAVDKYAVSHFLLFLSSTLGALTLMMVRLPSGIAPGVAPASELLRKASIVVLLVTVHTVAAESLGKDVILFCMPEFVPVLLWFSVHLDRGSSIISVDKIKSCKSWLVVLSAVVAAVFAYLGASMGESGLSRCTRALVSCGISGLLIYYVVFMLRQWPGQAGMATPSLEETTQLLRFWANALLIAAAALTVFTSLAAARLGLYEPTVAALAKLFDEYVMNNQDC